VIQPEMILYGCNQSTWFTDRTICVSYC